MRKFSVLALISLLALSVVPAAAVAQSATNWVSVVSITDLTGNSAVQPSQPLLAGRAYNVTMKVTVPFNQTSSRFSLQLNGVLLAYKPQFWYIRPPQYAGYNASSFTPGSHTLSFEQIEGTLILSSIFEFNKSITLITGPGNFTRHQPIDNFTVITVSVTGGAQVGQFSAVVEDQTIQTYLLTYQQKSTLIPSGQINSAYSTFVNGVLAEAQALYALGLPDQGTILLNTINPVSFPAPPNTTTFTTLMVAVVVAAIVIILLAVMILRGRGKQGYSAGIVGEVQKEMALLEVTAAKYDKALADRLQALRNKLGEAD